MSRSAYSLPFTQCPAEMAIFRWYASVPTAPIVQKALGVSGRKMICMPLKTRFSAPAPDAVAAAAVEVDARQDQEEPQDSC